MSALTILPRKLIGLVLAIIGCVSRLCKRAMCRVKGHRRDSGNILPVSTKHLQAASQVSQSVPANDTVELESWDVWTEDRPLGVSVQDHHGNLTSVTQQQNGNHHSNNRAESDEEPDVDFFQDMAPTLKKSKKILIKKRQELNVVQTNTSSRFALQTEIPTAGAELDEWQDDTNAWDEDNEDLSMEAEATIREKRRFDSERRHLENQRRKVEKEAQRSRKSEHFNAVRLS